MAWTNVLDDLRNVLADREEDKLAYRKQVFGLVNGTNVTFKTFEWRRLTDFTTSTAPLGVYVDGEATDVDTDDQFLGEFALEDAPTGNATVTATYYYQWFQDSDLQGFIAQAVSWLNAGGSADIVPDGLRPAILSFASSKAYQNLVSKFSINYSNMYRTEDQPNENRETPIDSWTRLAKSYLDEATKLRDQYYRRSGQALQPLTGAVLGSVTDVVPRR